MGDKVSSSKPKAKSTVNEQVKAGLAALKDFLGGHNEADDDPHTVTNEGRSVPSQENSSTEEGMIVGNAGSSAEATSDRSPSKADKPKTGENAMTASAAGTNQVNSPMKSNDHSEQTGNSSSEVKTDSPKPADAPAQPTSAAPEPPDKDAATNNKTTEHNSEGDANEPAPGQQSIDQASFEDAVEILRAAGPSGGRAAAARTIAELGSQRATPHLIAAMFDDDPDVRSAAEEALARIGEPTFKHTPTPQVENLTMMQPPSSAPQRSESPKASGGTAQAQPTEGKQVEARQKDEQQQKESRAVDAPSQEVRPAPPASKPHKLKAVPNNKTEAAIDPEASEEEQQLLLEERAVRQRLGLIVQQLS